MPARFERFDHRLQKLSHWLTGFRGGTRLAQRLVGLACRCARRDLIGHSPDGFQFHMRATSVLELPLFIHYFYEKEIRDFIRDIIKSQSVFVDIGANIGCFSLQACTLVGSAGRVLALEPDAAAFDRLQANVHLNNFRNIEILPLAAGRKSGEQRLYSGGSDWSHCSALYPSTWHDPNQFRVVPVRPLDEIVDRVNLSRLDLIKIDTEGAELDVLAGARGALEELRPILIIEVNTHTSRAAGWKAGDLEEILRSSGYALYHLKAGGNLVSLAQVPSDTELTLVARHPTATDHKTGLR